MRRPLVALLLTTCALGTLCACSMSPSMEITSPEPVQLGGRWLLDRHASDDVRARLMPVIERKERRTQRDERRYDDSPPPPPPDAQRGPGAPQGPQGEVSTIRWMQMRRQREAQSLIATLSPGGQLDIAQSPREIRISSDKGEGSRTLTPGRVSSLFTAIGGFQMSSGWVGTTFVVDSRGTGDNEMHAVERYTLIEEGAAMEARLDVKLPDLGRYEFRFVYRRAGRSTS